MRISRFYWRGSLAPDTTIELDSQAAHYLRDVLRLRVGAQVTVFNGGGGEFAALVRAVHRDGATLEIGAWRAVARESPLRVHIGMGVARSERMDWAIQKSVELGVSAITPLLTDHSVVVLKGEKARQRQQHWQRVVDSACEQCGRDRVPEVHEALKLSDWLAITEGSRVLLDPSAGTSLDALPPPTSITLLSGPEGGFSEAERALAYRSGFIGIRLGPRILRTETAALTALSAMQVLWGDLGRTIGS